MKKYIKIYINFILKISVKIKKNIPLAAQTVISSKKITVVLRLSEIY